MLELLFVVGLVLLLAGLFLPAMANGAARFSLSRCMNNAKQLAFAAHLYATDNRDLWPANGMPDRTLNLANPPPNYVPRVWAESREISNTPSQEVADGMVADKVSLLAHYVRDKKVFTCPEDRVATRVKNTSLRRTKSYGMNLFMGWTPDRITANYHGEPHSESQTFMKPAGIPKPGDLFLFGEIHPFSDCIPAFGSHPRWDSRRNPTGENLVFHFPANLHGQRSVFAMADGHAAVRRWIHPIFKNPPVVNHPWWHTHEGPIPGVNAAQVAPDFKWFSLHTTVPK